LRLNKKSTNRYDWQWLAAMWVQFTLALSGDVNGKLEGGAGIWIITSQ
jgi:hypothetical protein